MHRDGVMTNCWPLQYRTLGLTRGLPLRNSMAEGTTTASTTEAASMPSAVEPSLNQHGELVDAEQRLPVRFLRNAHVHRRMTACRFRVPPYLLKWVHRGKGGRTDSSEHFIDGLST